MLASAGNDSALGHRHALDKFLDRYLGPLRAYLIAARHINLHEADDLLQEFVTQKILRQHLIGRAQRSRGRFRTFLLRALDRFLINQFQKRQAQKRGYGREASLDDREFVNRRQPEPCEVFVIAWAREVLGRTISQMRIEYTSSGRAGLFEMFDARVLAPALSGGPPEPLEPWVDRLSLISSAEASNLIATAKRKFARTLRDVVSEYCASPNEIDTEIKEMWEIVSRDRR